MIDGRTRTLSTELQISSFSSFACNQVSWQEVLSAFIVVKHAAGFG